MRVVIASVVASMLVGCQARDESDWFVYTPADGAFELSFPEEPVADVQTLGTYFGRLEMHVVALDVRGEDERQDRGFIVRYGEMPAHLIERSDPQAILDGLRDGMLGTIDGRLLEERHTALGSAPGRTVRLTSSTGEAQVLGRIYLAGLRIYQLMSVGAPAVAGDEDAMRFLDSFQLLNER